MHPIRSDESYTIKDFQILTGLGQKAIREAERDGLQCVWVGSRKFITGTAWLAFLDAQSAKPAPNRGQRDAGEPKQAKNARGCIKPKPITAEK